MDEAYLKKVVSACTEYCLRRKLNLTVRMFSDYSRDITSISLDSVYDHSAVNFCVKGRSMKNFNGVYADQFRGFIEEEMKGRLEVDDK